MLAASIKLLPVTQEALETGMSLRPFGCTSKVQPAGKRLFLYPIMKNFQEGLYNIKFLILQNSKFPHFFPASRTKKTGKKNITPAVSIFRGGKELPCKKWTWKHYSACWEEHFSTVTLFAH